MTEQTDSLTKLVATNDPINAPSFLEGNRLDTTEYVLDNVSEILEVILHSLKLDVVYLYRESQGVIATFSIVDGMPEKDQENLDNLEKVHQKKLHDRELPLLLNCKNKFSPEDFYLKSIKSLIAVRINSPNLQASGYIAGFSRKPQYQLGEPDLKTLSRFVPFLSRQLGILDELRDTQKNLVKRIQSVIRNNNFVIYYQPIYHNNSGKIVAFEALTRFTVLPHISPAKWIQDAINVGLSRELEMAIIKKAIKGLRQIPNDVYLSINVSPRHILSDDVFHVLNKSLRKRIVLEITEHESINNYDALVNKLQELRESGLRIAIDDAGAGYSSFRHILNLKPDFIKLDMSITRDIDTDLSKRSLASAVILFAKETGSKVIAEGVETDSERKTLSKLGIEKIQGYIIGRPLPIARALEMAKPNW